MEGDGSSQRVEQRGFRGDFYKMKENFLGPGLISKGSDSSIVSGRRDVIAKGH